MKRWMITGLAIGAVAIVAFKMRTPARAQTNPILVAHRGANRLADENTLAAYERAIEFGMDYIECDPRLTRDGFLIIMHDNAVDRTTNGTGKVADMTFEEIRALRTKSGATVPTFDEVLGLAHDKDAGVYIDTKLDDEDYLRKVMTAVEAEDMASRVIVQLWRVDPQKWMQTHYPNVQTGLSYPAPVPSLKKLKDIGVEWAGMLVPHATDSVIAKCHALGLKVITLPINDVDTLREKYEAGMDALQTDDPAMLDAFIQQIRKTETQ